MKDSLKTGVSLFKHNKKDYSEDSIIEDELWDTIDLTIDYVNIILERYKSEKTNYDLEILNLKIKPIFIKYFWHDISIDDLEFCLQIIDSRNDLLPTIRDILIDWSLYYDLDFSDIIKLLEALFNTDLFDTIYNEYYEIVTKSQNISSQKKTNQANDDFKKIYFYANLRNNRIEILKNLKILLSDYSKWRKRLKIRNHYAIMILKHRFLILKDISKILEQGF